MIMIDVTEKYDQDKLEVKGKLEMNRQLFSKSMAFICGNIYIFNK